MLLEMTGVEKSFPAPTGEKLSVLENINLSFDKGESIAIIGSSGGGKTTLLNILGGLLRPSAGSVKLDGIALDQMNDQALSDLRNKKIGFIFQGSYLLPTLTVVENILVPTYFQQGKTNTTKTVNREKAVKLAEKMGLDERLDHLPNQLSLGQRRRVAIARALINDPVLLLADEPTNDLDPERATQIGDILFDLNKQGIGLVLITHHLHLAARAGKKYLLENRQVFPVELKAKENVGYDNFAALEKLAN